MRPSPTGLSVFWGSLATIGGKAQGGRFPPVDLLDLKDHGRLLAGSDVRDQVRAPSASEMVVAAARQALARFSSDEATAQCRDPTALVAAGTRSLTKRVLFPVRYLYTARTGLIGFNDAAVAHFLAAESGPAAQLASEASKALRALRARRSGGARQGPRGLLPIYRMFVEEYAKRLRVLGERELANAFEQWRARLG